jgi:signal transduction histidine kinase
VNSLRGRMTVWFGAAFLAVVALFTVLTRNTLEQELRDPARPNNHPDHPEWKLHGSYSEEEIQDIASELMVSALVWSVPLIITALVGGYWMAHQSLRPIARVNDQLAEKNPDNLGRPIELAEADEEFQDLLRQLNALLARLDASFIEMNNYAAKVAHELRTPLTILRLKVEQAGDRIEPGLADEFESELHRLGHVVDQSLFIARAERGHVSSERIIFDLPRLVKDAVEDFQLIAAEQDRHLTLATTEECHVFTDPRHLRQIIHNLLTNALKHGQEKLTVRVHRRQHRAVLVIANRVGHKSGSEPKTLGLGLRVITTLLKLEPNIRYRCRHGHGYYVARLSLSVVEPAGQPPSPPASARPDLGPA